MNERIAGLAQKLENSRSLLKEITAKVEPDDWGQNQANPEHWPARDILAHLLAAEQGLRGRINRILAGEDTKPPPDFDLNRWNQRQVEKRRSMTPADIMPELDKERQTTFALLNGVKQAALDLPGFPATGQPSTVAGVFERIADHETEHAKEIAAAAGVE